MTNLFFGGAEWIILSATCVDSINRNQCNGKKCVSIAMKFAWSQI
jgi:hypothetical protein